MPAEFDKLWNFEKPAETEARFRELLAEARASWPRPELVELLTQIARAEGLQQKFDEAHRTLDEAGSILGDGGGVARTRCLLERGRVFNSSGRPEKARPLFVEAWEGAANDVLAVDAAHMVAIVEKGEAALAWNRKAIARAEASKEERARNWLGALYNNSGWACHDMGRHAEALSLFEKALRWREPKGPPREIRIARWCVARCKRSLGRIEEALAMQLALLREIEEGDGGQDGFVSEEIGECLLALGRKEEARPHFRAAHALLSKDPSIAPARLNRLSELAE